MKSLIAMVLFCAIGWALSLHTTTTPNISSTEPMAEYIYISSHNPAGIVKAPYPRSLVFMGHPNDCGTSPGIGLGEYAFCDPKFMDYPLVINKSFTGTIYVGDMSGKEDEFHCRDVTPMHHSDSPLPPEEMSYSFESDFTGEICLNNVCGTIDQWRIKVDSNCPKCGKPMEVVDNMFHWRGRNFKGYVCPTDNALYDYPEDSFLEHVGGKQ